MKLLKKLNKELETAQKTIEEQNSIIWDLKTELNLLAKDLKGVVGIMDCMHDLPNFTDEDVVPSMFNNISRLISDIAKSMIEINTK
jgi:hypothetical protein